MTSMILWKNMSELLETYLMTLVHPFRIHQQFRHQLPLPDQDGHLFEPLTLAESVGISWVFAIVRGLFKIVILNFFLNSFLALQSPEFEVLQDLVRTSGFSTYYFFLFSAALDIIFYPIGALILTEVWSWIIKTYARFLNPELPGEEIAHQITIGALSSNLFNIIPFVGEVIQFFAYLFLLYAGLRANLGASRSLAIVILLTPTVFLMMALSLIFFLIFYLVSA
ncbi:MAG: hypothetical protein ACJ76H_17035 [Bacteriovoracaceae bacterium]